MVNIKLDWGSILTFVHTSDYTLICRGVAQTASAPRLGRGGRRFKSAHPDLLHEWEGEWFLNDVLLAIF